MPDVAPVMTTTSPLIPPPVGFASTSTSSRPVADRSSSHFVRVPDSSSLLGILAGRLYRRPLRPQGAGRRSGEHWTLDASGADRDWEAGLKSDLGGDQNLSE